MCGRRRRRPAWTGWSVASSAQALRSRSGGPTPRSGRGSPSWTEASVAVMHPYSGMVTKPGTCGKLAARAQIYCGRDRGSEALPKRELSAGATDTACYPLEVASGPFRRSQTDEMSRAGIGLPPVIDRFRVQRSHITVSGSGEVRFTLTRLRVVRLGRFPPLGGS